MSFTADAKQINKMIEYGSTLLNEEFEEYLSKMIKEYYPNARKDVIDTMMEWADYPELSLCMFEDLKQMEIDLLEHGFFDARKDEKGNEVIIEIVSTSGDFRPHDAFNSNSYLKYYFMTNSEKPVSWKRLIEILNFDGKFVSYIVQRKHGWSNVRPERYTYNPEHGLKSHIRFTNIIHQIWSKRNKVEMNINERIDLLENNFITDCEMIHDNIVEVEEDMKNIKHEIINELKPIINGLVEKNTKLQEQLDFITSGVQSVIDVLVKKNNELQEQVDQLSKNVDMFREKLNVRDDEPYNTNYDYDGMKMKRTELHSEFKRIWRLFNKSIKLTYEQPLAIAVPVGNK